MASTVYYSITRKPTDGITTVWEFSFAGGYIDPRNVKARTITAAGVVKDLPVQPADVIGTNQLRITPALPAGLTLEIYRDTPKEQPLVDFTDGAILSEASLQRNARQAILAVAEMVDRFADTDALAAETAAIAANAMSTADEALRTAQNAVVKADSAIATANTAFTSAGQANATAAGAVSTANAASSKADNAISTANAASSKSDAAVATANSVQSIANEANDNSEEALRVARGIDGKATQALDNSSTALDTANVVDGKATSALSNSEQALLQATEANDLASGLDQQIRDANDAASGAVSTASQAAQDAANAVDVANAIDGKAQRALDTAGTAVTTATEAKTIASQAMSAAEGAMKGTNNLSELTNAVTARSNLGLGNASTATRQVSVTDSKVGRLMGVGAFGTGVHIKLSGNLNTYTSVGGVYVQTMSSAASADLNYPARVAGILEVFAMSDLRPGAAGVGQRYTVYNSGTCYYRQTSDGSTWTPWTQYWDSKTFNPDTKADTNQAVSSFSGNFPYSRIDGKPSTFPPTVGYTATTAKPGNWVPSWNDIQGKPSLQTNESLVLGSIGQLALVRSRYHDTSDAKLYANSIVPGSAISVVDIVTGEWGQFDRRQIGFSLREDLQYGSWRVLNSSNKSAPLSPSEYGLYLAIRIS